MKTKTLLYLVISVFSNIVIFNSCEKDSTPDPTSDPIPIPDTASIEIAWLTKANMPDSRYSGDAVVCNDKVYHIGGRSFQSVEKSNFEYDPIQDLWNTKAEMQEETMNLALAAVGDNIYSIGGDPFLSKNEIYNSITNTWTYGEEMPTPRQHVDCGVVDGKIYVIGGLTSWEEYTGINEAYNPTTNTWAIKAAMPTARHNPAIEVYKNKINSVQNVKKERKNLSISKYL
jgi:N-acetylneuraminic acid mutarotase